MYFLLFLYLSSYSWVVFVLGLYIAKSTVKSLTTRNITVSRYSEIPHDDENIGRFQYESHNFECLPEKVQCIHQWPIMSIVNLTRALTCDLMLETFTIGELLKLAQSTLMMFEYKMDGISAQITAYETLKISDTDIQKMATIICCRLLNIVWTNISTGRFCKQISYYR